MKERILDEIRRLARESGGKPPGVRTFQRKTGIAQSDWYGKLWLRWNDAVADAGFAPNEKMGRLPSGLVLEKYAEVCRHYGKLPSNAELQYYSKEITDFPNYRTFSRHFGSKSELIAALRDRAIERGESDLVSMLPVLLGAQLPSEGFGRSRALEGWVYLLQSGRHYKIDCLSRSLRLAQDVEAVSHCRWAQ